MGNAAHGCLSLYRPTCRVCPEEIAVCDLVKENPWISIV